MSTESRYPVEHFGIGALLILIEAMRASGRPHKR